MNTSDYQDKVPGLLRGDSTYEPWNPDPTGNYKMHLDQVIDQKVHYQSYPASDPSAAASPILRALVGNTPHHTKNEVNSLNLVSCNFSVHVQPLPSLHRGPSQR